MHSPHQRPSYCGDCGAPLDLHARFCGTCGSAADPDASEPFEPARSAQHLPATGYSPADGLADFWTSRPPPSRSLPLAYAVEYPPRVSRWRVLLRPLLVVPHIIGLLAVGIAVMAATGVGWVAIVLTGCYPHGLWRFAAAYLRRVAAVLTYAALLRDQMPPLWNGAYPMRFAIEHPTRQSRVSAVLRAVAILPAFVALACVQIVWCAVWLIAWPMCVLTGEHPLGLWRFGQGTTRWTLRVMAYGLLLTDIYPPYTLDTTQTPGVKQPVLDVDADRDRIERSGTLSFT